MADTEEDVEETTDEDSFSDDSSFYGDDELKDSLEERAANFDSSPYWTTFHPRLPAVIAYNNTKAEEAASSAPDRELYDAYEGISCARQLSETVAAFLTRLPPLTTTSVGPWISIGNPHTAFRHTSQDQRGLSVKGRELLEEFDTAKAKIETSMSGKPKAIITRKIMPLRKRLEIDLLATAKATGCTTGKWMLFPSPDHVNSSWKLVAEATANNELGLAAKVAAAGGDGDDPGKARLICVYTVNFEDKKDVKRVCEKLHAMGLVNRNPMVGEVNAIYYKADAYTYLDIVGGNQWGLKPSLYSSRDIMKEDV